MSSILRANLVFKSKQLWHLTSGIKSARHQPLVNKSCHLSTLKSNATNGGENDVSTQLKSLETRYKDAARSKDVNAFSTILAAHSLDETNLMSDKLFSNISQSIQGFIDSRVDTIPSHDWLFWLGFMGVEFYSLPQDQRSTIFKLVQLFHDQQVKSPNRIGRLLTGLKRMKFKWNRNAVVSESSEITEMKSNLLNFVSNYLKTNIKHRQNETDQHFLLAVGRIGIPYADISEKDQLWEVVQSIRSESRVVSCLGGMSIVLRDLEPTKQHIVFEATKQAIDHMLIALKTKKAPSGHTLQMLKETLVGLGALRMPLSEYPPQLQSDVVSLFTAGNKHLSEADQLKVKHQLCKVVDWEDFVRGVVSPPGGRAQSIIDALSNYKTPVIRSAYSSKLSHSPQLSTGGEEQTASRKAAEASNTSEVVEPVLSATQPHSHPILPMHTTTSAPVATNTTMKETRLKNAKSERVNENASTPSNANSAVSTNQTSSSAPLPIGASKVTVVTTTKVVTVWETVEHRSADQKEVLHCETKPPVVTTTKTVTETTETVTASKQSSLAHQHQASVAPLDAAEKDEWVVEAKSETPPHVVAGMSSKKNKNNNKKSTVTPSVAAGTPSPSLVSGDTEAGKKHELVASSSKPKKVEKQEKFSAAERDEAVRQFDSASEDHALGAFARLVMHKMVFSDLPLQTQNKFAKLLTPPSALLSDINSFVRVVVAMGTLQTPWSAAPSEEIERGIVRYCRAFTSNQLEDVVHALTRLGVAWEELSAHTADAIATSFRLNAKSLLFSNNKRELVKALSVLACSVDHTASLPPPSAEELQVEDSPFVTVTESQISCDKARHDPVESLWSVHETVVAVLAAQMSAGKLHDNLLLTVGRYIALVCATARGKALVERHFGGSIPDMEAMVSASFLSSPPTIIKNVMLDVAKNLGKEATPFYTVGSITEIPRIASITSYPVYFQSKLIALIEPSLVGTDADHLAYRQIKFNTLLHDLHHPNIPVYYHSLKRGDNGAEEEIRKFIVQQKNMQFN